MQLRIFPGPLSGTITPPPSKSQAHRLLIGAALAGGESTVRNLTHSRDIDATVGCMEALGASFRWAGDSVTVRGAEGALDRLPRLDCGESGSTLRFLIPVALALAGGGAFTGRGRLLQRPQQPYFDLFREKGIAFSPKGDTLTVQGTLPPGVYALPGNVSSQFVTGLLYALPLLDGDSEIVLTTALESAGYIDMTIDALRTFGIMVTPTERGWQVPGNQRYRAQSVTVEADWSQGAFFLAAQGLGNPLTVSGLDPDSRQGDRIMADYAARLEGPGTVELDVRGCPDLVPALAVRAALRDGEVTQITNAARLRLKESDRLTSVTAVLRAMGADISEEPDSLTIRGKAVLSGGVTVDSWNDHRIAMMAAIGATRCEAPVTLTGAEAVDKSYPAFWEDFRRLGGALEEVP